LFLWEVRRAAHKRRAGWDQWEEDGKVFRAQAPRWIELSYFVTAWASELRDEHQLLGSVLQAVLLHPSVPPDAAPEPLLGITTEIGMSIAATGSGDQKSEEFWRALDGQLKPGLQMSILVNLPAGAAEKAPPAPEERSVAIGDTTRPDSEPSTVSEGPAEASNGNGGARRARRRQSELEEGVRKKSGG
jgi:hypothetical protein